ncbi:unnamed protein product, partial [Oncorhynchus mykiss]
MSKLALFNVYITERLTAAAVEIAGVVERTVTEYQEEISRSKEENERLRRLLDFKPHRTVCVCVYILVDIGTAKPVMLEDVASSRTFYTASPDCHVCHVLSVNLLSSVKSTGRQWRICQSWCSL